MICCVGRYDCEQRLVDSRSSRTIDIQPLLLLPRTSYFLHNHNRAYSIQNPFQKEERCTKQIPIIITKYYELIVGVRRCWMGMSSKIASCVCVEFGSFFPPYLSSFGSCASRHIFWIFLPSIIHWIFRFPPYLLDRITREKMTVTAHRTAHSSPRPLTMMAAGCSSK